MSDEDMRDAFNSSMMSTGFLCDGPLEVGRKDGRRWLATAYEAGGVVLHQSNAVRINPPLSPILPYGYLHVAVR